MELTFRKNTIPAMAATGGIVQLLGVSYVWFLGFNASPTVGYTWTALFIVFAVATLLGGHVPDWARGIAAGIMAYSGSQTAAYWFTTPTPPERWEYIVGTGEGLLLLITAYAIKQWIDAGVRAAKMDAEALNSSESSSS